MEFGLLFEGGKYWQWNERENAFPQGKIFV
jgi:hypothetical protein